MTITYRAAATIMQALARATAWAIKATGRQVQHYALTDEDCEAEGVPLGTTEPCIYVQPLGGSKWWRVAAWDDGDCVHLRAMGWAAEVHHEGREVVPAGA